MHSFWKSSLSIFTTLLLTGCSAQPSSLTQSYSRTPGFSFNYPAGWQIEAEEQWADSLTVTLVSEEGLGTAGQHYEAGQYLLSVSVSDPVQDVGPIDPLWLNVAMAAELGNGDPEVEELSAARMVTLGGDEFALAAYRVTDGNDAWLTMMATHATAETTFLAIGYASIEEEESFGELFEGVLASLEFHH